MEQPQPLLEHYLFTRGLVDPAKLLPILMSGKTNIPVGADILANDELLAQVAGLYRDKRKALEAVISARLLPMVLELVVKAYPQETIVIRQAIVEVGAILDDFARYEQEYTRREKERAVNAEKSEDRPDKSLTPTRTGL